LLSQIHDHVVVRLPLVPEMNDSEDDIGLAVRFISTLNKVEGIHLLPYHRAGIAKYTGLSRAYELDEMKSLADAHVLRAVEIFRENGFEVVVGG
jgi:pyruvate formate lyase activating enzyme